MEVLLAQAAETATSSTAEAILFWVFAVIGVGAALAMISLKNIVHAALMLVLNLLAIAALYIGLQSSFLGIIQIIVYAGAIMVLFLFVIMLLGVTRDDLLFETRRSHKLGAGLGGAALVGLVLFAFAGDFTGSGSRCGAQADTTTAAAGDAVPCEGLDTLLAETDEGSVGIIARRMFTRYTFPFEVSALLLVVATIGALVIGRRHDPAPDEDLPDGGGSAARRSPDADLGGASASDRPTDRVSTSDAGRVLPGESPDASGPEVV